MIFVLLRLLMLPSLEWSSNFWLSKMLWGLCALNLFTSGSPCWGILPAAKLEFASMGAVGDPAAAKLNLNSSFLWSFAIVEIIFTKAEDSVFVFTGTFFTYWECSESSLQQMLMLVPSVWWMGGASIVDRYLSTGFPTRTIDCFFARIKGEFYIDLNNSASRMLSNDT